MSRRRNDGDDPTVAGRIGMLKGAAVPAIIPSQQLRPRDVFDEDTLVPIERVDFSARPIDPETVQRLAALQLDDEELMDVLKVDKATLDTVYGPYINNGRAQGRVALRRMQWRKAMQGNVPMLLHLGGQYLGQTEKKSVAHTHEGKVGLELTDSTDPAQKLLNMLQEASSRIKSGQRAMLPQPELETPDDEI